MLCLNFFNYYICTRVSMSCLFSTCMSVCHEHKRWKRQTGEGTAYQRNLHRFLPLLPWPPHHVPFAQGKSLKSEGTAPYVKYLTLSTAQLYIYKCISIYRSVWLRLIGESAVDKPSLGLFALLLKCEICSFL